MAIDKDTRELAEQLFESLEDEGFRITDFDLEPTKGTDTGVRLSIDGHMYE